MARHAQVESIDNELKGQPFPALDASATSAYAPRHTTFRDFAKSMTSFPRQHRRRPPLRHIPGHQQQHISSREYAMTPLPFHAKLFYFTSHASRAFRHYERLHRSLLIDARADECVAALRSHFYGFTLSPS